MITASRMKVRSGWLRSLSAVELRQEISARNLARGQHYSHEVSWGPSASVIFEEAKGFHGNFLSASWTRISSNTTWLKRLKKSYTASRYIPRAQERQRFELDCANSSDALLMNIFLSPSRAGP